MNLVTLLSESISWYKNFVATVNDFYDLANSKSVNNHRKWRLFLHLLLRGRFEYT